MNERIVQLIDFLDISMSKFEQSIGASNGVIRKAISNNTDIQSKWLKAIADNYPNLSLEWLITGKGEMLKVNTESNITVREFKHETDDTRRSDWVPLYNIEAVAGVVAIFDDLHNQKPTDYLSIPNLPKCDGAVYVTGDSMYPLLKSGDIIAYKVLNDKTNIFWGEMYLLSIDLNGDTYITVKYVQKSNIEGYVNLVSQNQYHQDKEVPFDSIKFAALVKASIRINSMG